MPTLVNICGEGRSGTTMLDLMVGHGEDAFSCGEVYAWFRPWRTHHWNIVCSCGKRPCPVWEKIKGVPEDSFHATAAKRLGVEFVVDSSKELRWLIDTQDWAARAGMKVINLLIWKAPEELSFSHWKRGGSPLAWRRPFVEYHAALLDLRVPLVTVRFRDLAEQPRETMQTICSRVGMAYFEGKEEFWEHRSHHLFGSMGTRKQVEAGVSRIQSDTGFPREFEALLQGIDAELAGDARLEAVIRELKRRDVSDGEQADEPAFEWPRVMPMWYYVRWVKSAVRRRFPQKWHLSQ